MAGHCTTRLDAYLEDALPPRSRRAVQRHLECCPECRDRAVERSRVLAAARTVVGRPVGAPALAPTGVPGRLVVGVLAAVVLAAALVSAAWLAGAPRTVVAERTPRPEDALALVGGAAPQDGAEGERRLAGSDAVGEERAARAADEVSTLRAHGWAVPSLAPAGLRPLAVDSRRSADGVEVTVSWGRTDPVVTVSECRSGGGATDEEHPTCPGGVPAPTIEAVAHRLPVGVDYELAETRDGRWDATLRTSDATYRVRAQVPREQAEALLTQVVLADRAGVRELGHEDAVLDRIERGLDRLVDGAGEDVGPGSGADVGGAAVLPARG